MSERRARNIVSRTAALAVRAAELLDDGLGDAEVAKKLNEEFGRTGADKIKARAVYSFRHDDSPGGYSRVQAERQDRIDAAAEANLITAAAGENAGGKIAQSATDMLAQMFFKFIREKKVAQDRGEPVDGEMLLEMGKGLAKFREVTISEVKIGIAAQNAARANEAIAVASDETIDKGEREKRAKQILGMAA